MIPKLMKSLVLSALLVGGTAGAASAHTPSDPALVKDLNRLAAASNLVVQSKVTRVTYKMAAGTNGSKGVPYTYVTFSIAGVLQGNAPGSTVTLRFIGGPDGQGGFLSVEGVPTFQVGDQDILFVAGNGDGAGCALVMCEFGRFRVHNNAVHGAHGEPILSVAGGKLTVGSGYGPSAFQVIRFPTPSFDEMLKNPAFTAAVSGGGPSLANARARYQAQAPKSIVIREVDSAGINGPMQAAAQPVSGLPVQQFLSSVRTAAAASSLRAFSPLQSANVNAALTAPAAAGVAPRAGSAGPAASPGPVIKKN